MRSKALLTAALLMFAMSMSAEDSAATFQGRWSWAVIGANKVTYFDFDGEATIHRLLMVVNPLDKTTSMTIDPVAMSYFVTPGVKLLTIRLGTSISVYQYEFLSKDRVLLTDTSTNDNPTKVFMQLVKN